ncbi:hypothetical protein ACFXHA_25480 [Nocardia sp. NPDC059240]|uniref:hypothetical protein n=1 Tax=Nocardia sp. NPDC059240 TaxID=3346786 RepID=UPI00368262AD
MERAVLAVLAGLYLGMAVMNGRVVRRILKQLLPRDAGNCAPIGLHTVGDWNRAQRWIIPFRLTAIAVYASAVGIALWACAESNTERLPVLIVIAPVVVDLVLYGASYVVVHARLSPR